MKNLLVILSGVGALLIGIPVIYRIHEGDLFNPTSYFLWSLISLICFVVLLRAKKGGHTLLAGYFLSDLVIGIYAYVKSGQASFGWFQWFVIFLTGICIVVYVRCEVKKKNLGPEEEENFKSAVIVNTVACMIAGIPQLIDSIRYPQTMSLTICWLYILVSAFGYFGERNFNGKLLPGVSIIYWIVIIIGMSIQR